jgi:hypothetical protein
MKSNVLVCTLAAQIRKNDKSVTLADAMKAAWVTVKTNKTECKLLVFVKVDGTECRRVVSENWLNYYTPTGTGRAVKPGLRLFADLGKFIGGQNCIISAYEDKIVSIN